MFICDLKSMGKLGGATGISKKELLLAINAALKRRWDQQEIEGLNQADTGLHLF